jgi:hypothetical protein
MNYYKILVIMTIIFSLVMLFTITSALKNRKYSFLFEDITTYVSYLIFLVLQYILNFQVKSFIIFLVLITIIGNSLIGNYLNLYNSSKYYDRFLHALGSFSFSLFYYSILIKTTALTISPKFYISIFIAILGISLGCIFEIYEFITDSTRKIKNQHGLVDTDFDLISDVIGSVSAGILSIFILL